MELKPSSQSSKRTKHEQNDSKIKHDVNSAKTRIRQPPRTRKPTDKPLAIPNQFETFS